jgi:hypothetical protein
MIANLRYAGGSPVVHFRDGSQQRRAHFPGQLELSPKMVSLQAPRSNLDFNAPGSGALYHGLQVATGKYSQRKIGAELNDPDSEVLRLFQEAESI